MSLPSLEDASNALKTIGNDCEAWRDIVMRSIQYATTQDKNDDASGDTDANMKDAEAAAGGGDWKVNATVVYLLQSLNDESIFANSAMDVDVEGAAHDKNLRSVAESILVDALWLSGTMMEPLAGEESNESTAYSALCKLTHDLTQPHTINNKASNNQQQPPAKLTPIPRRKLLTTLEPAHLNASGILSDQFLQLFIKKIRKLNTDMYYRQKKVNLMQEESEGYAKFLRFLVNLPQVKDMDAEEEAETEGDDAPKQKKNTSSRKNTTRGIHCDETVQLAKLRITELIGTFDLDPNRCLDLTLDALEGEIRHSLQQLQHQQHRGNSNAGASTKTLYQLLRNAPGSAMTVHVLLNMIQIFPVENVTHLIGFKFSAYAKSKEGGSTSTTTPQSLYLTTVLLVSHRLLSLSALNPHLMPLESIEEHYSTWKNNYQKKIRKLGVVSLNSSTKKEVASEDSSEVEKFAKHNQAIQLFHLLLQMGIRWDVAIGIFDATGAHADADFSRTSKGENGKKEKKNVTNYIAKCCCLYPPLGSTLCDVLYRAIGPIYNLKVKDTDRNNGISKPSTSSSSKKEDGEEGEDEEGEVECDTADHIGAYSLLPVELCKKTVMELGTDLSLEQILKAIESVLEPIIVSGSIASDSALYTRLCRLVHSMLLESNADERPIKNVEDQVLQFMDRVLVPSLSLFPNNPAIATELWPVLSLLPYQIRYTLYSSWRKHGLEKAALRSMVQPPKPLAQVESEVNTGISTKYLLKRLSKHNIHKMGQQVSKVAHNNPLVVFTLILNQIESYDNLILMMVDTFKFMGSLSLDIMGYCLLVSLGGEGEGRSKLKDDGVNAAQWLASLETFTGAFYKKFTDVELHGLLAYFTRRLNDGQILELGVLQSLLKMAGGYGFVDSGSSASLSDVQLEGRCGSLVLRKETSDFGIVESVNLAASRRLRSSLQDDNRGVTFLILLSQLRAKVVYVESKERPKQIKLIGNLYDSCQRTLNTLLPFLTDGSQDIKDYDREKESTGAIESYAKVLPTLGDLYTRFGVAAADAWTLCRPLIRAALFAEEDLSGNKDAKLPAYLQRFHPSSDTVQKKYKDMLPDASWDHITPLLFSSFYSYAIYDVCCPEDRYRSESARIRREIDRLTLLQKGGRDAMRVKASMVSAVVAAGGTDQAIRDAATFTKEHSMELDRFNRTIELLSIDAKRQKRHYEHVISLLESDKAKFFADVDGGDASVDASSVFFTTCVYPRILLSPEDALYCSHFIMLLHNMDTPGFFTLKFLDVVISAVVGALYSITEDEAGCLGIFLCEQWRTISDWRYDEKSYEYNVAGKVSLILFLLLRDQHATGFITLC